MKLDHRLEIAAPLEKVWAATLDVETWPEWTPTMERVTRLDEGALRLGSRARIKQPGLPEAVWTVTELDAEAGVFAWRSRIRAMDFEARHELSEGASGATINRLEVEVTGFLALVMGPLLKGPLAKALSQENAGLKAFLEAG